MTEPDVVEVRIRIAARPSTVFTFFSDPERLRQWMGDADIPMRVGADIRVGYPQGSARGKVIELVPDRRIVFTWGYDGGPPAAEVPVGSSQVAIELTPIPSGTLLTLRHTGLPGAQPKLHTMGWRHYVSTLANKSASVAGIAEPAVEAYHAAWAETDVAKRAALLDRCWAPDAIFRDAMGYAEGRGELSDYIGAAQRFAPQMRLEREGSLMHAHGFINYRWRIVGPDGAVVTRGSNVGELSPDGTFLSMTGFWDPAAEASR